MLFMCEKLDVFFYINKFNYLIHVLMVCSMCVFDEGFICVMC